MDLIWTALLIPFVAVVVLAWKFPKQTNVLEYILAFTIPIFCIILGKYTSVYVQTKDTEYWNTYATKAVYEEEWRERWTEMETYTVTVGSGKNQHTETRTRMVTKYRTHPEEWYIIDNIQERYNITRNYFEQLCQMWGRRDFVDMQRGKGTSHTITKDGDAYVTYYDKIFDHTVPLCKKHNYKNKVQCSKSVFNFREVNEETKVKYGLFDYPAENLFGFSPVLGGDSSEAVLKLQKYNGLNGARRQLHMMLLIFKDQPLEAGLFQESYWKGGNKNEFIVCVGVTKDKIKWVKVISWTENDKLKVTTEREIKEMATFDPVKIVDYMGEKVTKGFLRKEFSDFDYLAVTPTLTAIAWTFAITFLSTFIICFIAVKNRHGFGTFVSRHRKDNWRYRY